MGLRPGIKAYVMNKTPEKLRLWADGENTSWCQAWRGNSVTLLPDVTSRFAGRALSANCRSAGMGCVGPEFSVSWRGASGLLDLGFVPGSDVGQSDQRRGPTAYLVRGALVACAMDRPVHPRRAGAGGGGEPDDRHRDASTTTAPTGRAQCSVYRAANLKKLGFSSRGLRGGGPGKPNSGKSTVLNARTGLRKHTGIGLERRVTRAEGGFDYHGKRYKLVDLPGTYSLLSTSLDEEIARDFILFGQPDVTIVVADATRLERNLNLVLQVLEITDRAVVCLNLMDEAKRHGLTVENGNCARSGRAGGADLGPFGQDLPELLDAVSSVAAGRVSGRVYAFRTARAQAVAQRTGEQAAGGYPACRTPAGLRCVCSVAMTHCRSALRRGELATLAERAPGATGELLTSPRNLPPHESDCTVHASFSAGEASCKPRAGCAAPRGRRHEHLVEALYADGRIADRAVTRPDHGRGRPLTGAWTGL